ncbi:MAG TPA: hypothetical protein VGJ66_04930 [Pyrinomonadaceae bacterium]|jgi:hypothetical protein
MKKLEPDSARFYALHDGGVSSETALRLSGYKVTNPRSVIDQKLFLRREAARPISAAGDEEETDPCSSEPGTIPFEYDRIGPDHPSASALTSAIFRAKSALGRQVKKGEISREQADELTRRYWKLSAALSPTNRKNLG